jgi:hypothetical protein
MRKLIAAFLIFAECVWTMCAQSWTLTTAPMTNWTGLAMSANGQRVVAAVASGPIYLSTNSGATWDMTTAPSKQWKSVASSADGSRILAGAFPPDGLWISTNFGATWEPSLSPSSEYFLVMGSSGDGIRLLAISSAIYTSTNGGASWRWDGTDGTTAIWGAAAASADGSTVMVLGDMRAYVDTMLISTNWGAAWTFENHLGKPWSSAAASANGRLLVAGSEYYPSGGIYTSTDYGVTWRSNEVPLLDWISTAVSADGTRIAAAAVSSEQPGPIYLSTDSGASWSSSEAPSNHWHAIASSADGCTIFAATSGGGIYKWQTTPRPALSICQAETGVVLSWVVPSTAFVLQQSPDLSAASWTDLGATPVLNYTNLHYEVTVPTSAAVMFYRLAGKSQ